MGRVSGDGVARSNVSLSNVFFFVLGEGGTGEQNFPWDLEECVTLVLDFAFLPPTSLLGLHVGWAS